MPADPNDLSWSGYLRADGRKGIRNQLMVVYLVECAHHVARDIASPYRDRGVQLIGFSGCYPNAYATRMLEQLCTHPNVGAVLLVSLGCESFPRDALSAVIASSSRPVHTLVIQQAGGTRASIAAGKTWVDQTLDQIATVARVPMGVNDLVIGTICGGSDATSGLTANSAIGLAFDRLVGEGAACLFEETAELVGCQSALAARAATASVAEQIVQSVDKAERFYRVLGHGSFATGNAEGELTTQEEKSMGSYCKSGSRPIVGLLRPGDRPLTGGLYLLDIVPDGEVRFGFPNINDNAEIGELIACGAHLILFSTGRGSVVGSAISPVIKICGNPETYRRMADDMDIDAGAVLEGEATLQEVAEEAVQAVRRVAAGEPTCSESLGHQEFVLVYKNIAPVGPACLPQARV